MLFAEFLSILSIIILSAMPVRLGPKDLSYFRSGWPGNALDEIFFSGWLVGKVIDD